MRKCVLCLLLFLSFASAALAQVPTGPVSVTPLELYRFRMSNVNLGYILTWSYDEGVNSGYVYDGIVGGIYPIPAAGYTPDPASGLVPLHRWTVIMHGRASTVHATYFLTNVPSNYTYDGIRGYVFPAGTTSHNYPGVTVNLGQIYNYYDQTYGYWYGRAGESPPLAYNYIYQGLLCASTPAATGTRPDFCAGQPFDCRAYLTTHAYDVTFYPPPPPPPPPTCDPYAEQDCYLNGGTWNSSMCTCKLPTTCPPGMICPIGPGGDS
jgi:hypothetical protein